MKVKVSGETVQFELFTETLTTCSLVGALSSVDLSSLSSSGGGTPVEGYGNIIPSLRAILCPFGDSVKNSMQ